MVHKTQTSSIWHWCAVYFLWSSPKPGTSGRQPWFGAWTIEAPPSPVRVAAFCRLFDGSCQMAPSRAQAEAELGLCQGLFQEALGLACLTTGFCLSCSIFIIIIIIVIITIVNSTTFSTHVVSFTYYNYSINKFL